MLTVVNAATEAQQAGTPESSLPLWLRRLLPGSIIALASLWVLRPLQDPDTFWHLAAGHWLRATWQFSGADPWSNSSRNTWVMHEWLPELVMSWLQDAFGVYSVVWLHAVTVTLLGLALWLSCRRRSSLLITAVVMVVSILAMSGSLSPRPHMVTFILTVLFTDSWLRSAKHGTPNWWLIPLSWIWACSHGMWFIGAAVASATLAGSALDGALPARSMKKLLLLLVATTAAAALTPAGPSLLLAPFQVNSYTRFVTEWAPPTVKDTFFVAFLILAGATLIVWARSFRRTSWTNLLLVGLSIALAFKYSRTVPVGACILAPICAGALQQSLRMSREELRPAERKVTATLMSIGLLVAAGLAPFIAGEVKFGPNGLNSALAKLPAHTALCNDYGIGGWLIWRHPNVRPAIDGRTEIYPVDYVQQYIDFTGAQPGWKEFLTRANCSYALLPSATPVVKALKDEAQWSEVASSDSYVLLKSPTLK